ncbi:hypothetical protein MNBD_GAMMA09-2391 [hydrothermal vent metagenome]|uniref:Uncharacterized protein n=1 Tax=hydrothermal vent metagenome TaxID=652676 RepID=A0A3B0YGW3_9ZZZZ
MPKTLIFLLLLLSFTCSAEDTIELRTTTIKGNKELPQILYVVPWKDIKRTKKAERKLVLHSLFGDLFDPVLPQQKSEDVVKIN